MTSADWLKLVAGCILGVFGKWLYDSVLEFKRRRKLRRKYGKLARTYANLREGTTPTGGHIQLTQRRDGAFDVVAYNQNNQIEWRSKINMSLEDENLGTGHYWYEATATDYGEQQVRYVPKEDVLHLVGVNRSTTTQQMFIHIWETRSLTAGLVTRHLEKSPRFPIIEALQDEDRHVPNFPQSFLVLSFEIDFHRKPFDL